MTAVAGLVAIVSSLRPFEVPIRRLNHVVNPVTSSTLAFAVAVGIGLLYLAGNLARRKRAAWVVTTVLFTAHLAVQVLHVLDGGLANPQATPFQLGFTIVMVSVLWLSRRDFPTKADPPSLFQFVKFVPLYVGIVLLYGIAALTLERDHLSPSPTLALDITTVLGEMVGIGGDYTYERRAFRLIFPNSVLLLGVVGLATALVLLFRPFVARPRTHEDWDNANRLVHQYGSDTLAFFALRHDKSYFFSSDGEAFIPYTYMGRHALASGDPIGRPESIDLVIDEFLAMCREHGWGFAFLAVRQADAARYTSRGLRSFYLGDEAVIDCSTFALEGKKNKSMRQSVQRVARTYRFEMLPESDASPELEHQLNTLSHKWRGKAPERGFTMALSQDVAATNPDYQLCVAYDEHDQPGGFLRVVPIYGDEPGATLDMMRRDPETPNGMTEFLITNTVFALRDQKLFRFSMNFAVMGKLFSDDLPFTRRQKMAKAFVSLFNPFFQIKSLHTFNRRFRPTWQPRVIIYEDQRSRPHVAMLYGGVEGFLSVPKIGKYFVPQRFDHESRN